MKKASFLFVFFLAQLLALAPAKAQSGAPAAQVPTGKLVIVYITEKSYRSYRASFETDGESIGGLQEEALTSRFSRTNSTAAILNFVVQNGYRVLSFSPVGGEIFNGNSRGFGGYAVLFEQVK